MINQSWLLGIGLSVPTGIVLLNISSLLNTAGISKDIAHAVQEYCSAISYGIIPTLLFNSDVSFALGIKQFHIITVSETTHAVLSMFLEHFPLNLRQGSRCEDSMSNTASSDDAVSNSMGNALGYSLILGAFGLPRLGIFGLGHGASLAAWLSFIGLRLYYRFSGRYHHFKLFNLNMPNVRETFKFFNIGLPFGLNNTIVGVNAMILSLLAGKLGKEVSISQEASSAQISAFNFILKGLMIKTGREISSSMGELKKAILEHNDCVSVERIQNDIKRFGHTGIIIGLAITFTACLICTGLSKKILETFIDTSKDISRETLQLSQTLLSINGVGLRIDAVKNISSYNLFSLEDTLFSSLFNVVSTFMIALPAGAYLSLQANQGAEWLFISQLLGGLITAIAIGHRWYKKSNF